MPIEAFSYTAIRSFFSCHSTSFCIGVGSRGLAQGWIHKSLHYILAKSDLGQDH